MKSKKGMKTILTIFAVIFLVAVFIIFIFLFRFMAANKSAEAELGASSLSTELLLNNFLISPVYDSDGNIPKDLFPDVGEDITNADLISWTCNKQEDYYDYNHDALKASLENFFDGIYDDDWELWIIYSNSSKKTFGHKSSLKKSINSLVTVIFLAGTAASNAIPKPLAWELFATPYREAGFGSQVIPCTDGQMAKIMFYSHTAFFEIKLIK
ncbi:MAG: hypothetical protein KKF46_07095 [Nanoarchaeota archaeon]|nr:hypothetical protein [Nanoarchaeota archaeon]MBU2442062.1 hypothetical protein [Nanoarchaeota archaeon]